MWPVITLFQALLTALTAASLFARERKISLFIVAMSTGRGSGHTLFPTTVGITRLWGIRLILGYFLAFTFGMGSLGAWLAISLSNVVGGIVSIVWVVYGNWAESVIEKESTL